VSVEGLIISTLKTTEAPSGCLENKLEGYKNENKEVIVDV
jgi:hypothetical protein